MNFKNNLKNLRNLNKFTQQEMSNKLNILLTSYQKYEQGSREPKLLILEQLTIIFNCTYDDLLK